MGKCYAISTCAHVHSWLLFLLGHKKLKCDECKERLTTNFGEVEAIDNELILRITSGGFLYPCSYLLQMVMVNNTVVNKIWETAEFQFSMS